jgi:hypothetical protein
MARRGPLKPEIPVQVRAPQLPIRPIRIRTCVRMPRYSETEARSVVAASRSYAESLRNLQMCPTGGATNILKKWIEIWGISTEHFDPRAARRAGSVGGRRPLAEVLVVESQFRRTHLKHRLFEEGLKGRECEICGQREMWRGRRLSLILDHVNGVRNDNRLENLRIVCPNCAATLDTHCGKNRRRLSPKTCVRCGNEFQPATSRDTYCSSRCGKTIPRPHTRKVERPSLDQLRSDVGASGYAAVGRKYGVSATSVRKWLRWYERDCNNS